MGSVVSIDGEGPRGRRIAAAAPRHRRATPSKTALVLGGGGLTGAVYEIGALRALDLLSVNRSVTDFDVYVGTSAGSFVASMVATGIAPEEMMRVVNRQAPTPFPDVDLGTLLHLNVLDLAGKALTFPWHLARLARRLVGQVGQVSALDIVLSLAEGMPSGFYSGAGIERYVRSVLETQPAGDDFRRIERELYLTATDLDTCERIVFGSEGWDEVPISTAVRASTALPMVYEPVKVGDRELVDGGIASTTNLDIAIDAGAKLVVVVNPLVPFVNQLEEDGGGARKRRVSEMGFPRIGYQTFKLMTYGRLHAQKAFWEQRYPGVDIVLIEPDPTDRLMFETSIMHFGSRVAIARHGFRSVTAQLAGDYDRLRAVAAKHGIEISATRVRKVVKHFAAEQEPTAAWSKILEQATGTLVRQSASTTAD